MTQMQLTDLVFPRPAAFALVMCLGGCVGVKAPIENAEASKVLSICDIATMESAYDGKLVRIHSHYIPFRDGSVMEDAACPSNEKYVMDIPRFDRPKGTSVWNFSTVVAKTWLYEAVTYDVDFVGVFHASIDPQSRIHGITGYFEVHEVLSYKVIGEK